MSLVRIGGTGSPNKGPWEDWDMARNTMSVTGRVTSVKRHGHTIWGNPMMSVQIDGGDWYRISNDAGIVYGIENAEYRDTPHTFELTGAGRISGRILA